MLKKKVKGKKSSKIGGIFRFMYKTFFNVPAWIGFKQIKDSHRTIMGYVKDATADSSGDKREESFKQATQRLNLDENQLVEIYRINKRNYYIFVGVAVLLGIYWLCLLIFGNYRALLVDSAVLLLVGVRLFQFSFWNFQIKHRKLGCSVKEWLFRTVKT